MAEMAFTGEMLVRKAVLDDLPALKELAVLSKAHWGYDAAFMAACEEELGVSPDELAQDLVMVADPLTGEAPLGFGCLGALEPGLGEIWNLFVHPDAMGKGVGRALLEVLVGQAKDQQMTRLQLDADPYARPFYERMGFAFEEEVPSGSIPGRYLPRMSLVL
ncbi:GNAT family N-acetyltransferase [Rhodovibrionaceae bacterium A322]